MINLRKATDKVQAKETNRTKQITWLVIGTITIVLWKFLLNLVF